MTTTIELWGLPMMESRNLTRSLPVKGLFEGVLAESLKPVDPKMLLLLYEDGARPKFELLYCPL